MGVDFTAIFEYQNVEFNKFFIDIQNRDIFTCFHEYIEDKKANVSHSGWSVDSNFSKYFEIHCPGMHIIFNKSGLCCIFGGPRWDYFLTNESERNRVSGACMEVAKHFLTNEIIYLPDHYGLDYIYSDHNWDALTKSLYRRLGKPRESIELIYKEYEDSIDTDGYYIDKFNM
ncbi:hypothetical protein [Paenibacillus sp. P46E]|uniref:hypothetical protein n=1 Tax=Paenibacillus sp. P46E TaxID=1349436 RepID=UPI000AF89A0C|nr:hypothetical protein [Paenibacillus sp. P46E]